jgi:hypothetical protein
VCHSLHFSFKLFFEKKIWHQGEKNINKFIYMPDFNLTVDVKNESGNEFGAKVLWPPGRICRYFAGVDVRILRACFRFLQTSPEGVNAAGGAAFLDPIEGRPWRSRDRISACVVGSFLIWTIATGIVRSSARHPLAALRARPPAKPLG